MPGSSNARPVICSVNVTKTSAVSQGPRKMLRLLLTWNWPYPTFCAFVLLLYFNRRKIRGWMSFFACCWKRQVRPDNSPSRRYLGLRNEGSTCYLNSILQCLFMTPEFTNSILSERDVIVNADRTVKKLQKLFIDLRFGNSTPSTRKLMNSLGIESGKQQDVEEYFRFLLNSIPEKMEAQKLFHIQVVHSITCEKCNTKDVIPYTWLSLPVSIKEENPSVQAAIDSFLKKLRFEGENRCYCENCGSKQDSISRNYFISLPRVLVIHLKRYEIYRGHFQKKFTAVSVENSLKIPLKKGADHAEYELFALCHHFGGLTGGHYTSEIKSSEDNQWYSFNDSNVMVVPPRERKKSETAYLLMYRKKQEDIPKFLEKDDLPKHVKFWIDELLKTSGSKGHKEFS